MERLNDEPRPNAFVFQHYAVSAHYGLADWNSAGIDGRGGKPHQISPDKLAE